MPTSNVKIDLKFLNPSPKDIKEWPMTVLNEKAGILTVTFENGDSQNFYLKGILKRPRIWISTTGNEAVIGPNLIDFKTVNVETERKANIFIMNETEVETKCTISHYLFQNKKVYGHMTISSNEQEDKDKTDDPSVFIFDSCEVSLYEIEITLRAKQ